MFYTKVYKCPLDAQKCSEITAFLGENGLEYDDNAEFTVCIYDASGISACGSIGSNVLKCIATSENYRGEGLLGQLMTELMGLAFEGGHKHLFIFTKPRNSAMFRDFGFYEISRTADMLLLENRKNGIVDFAENLQKGHGIQGAVVMNCNPFTLGHKYLAEHAAAMCDTLHLFVLSEDKSLFPAAVRLDLVRRGTAHIENIIVHETADYLISSATFPTYFLKDAQKDTGAAGLLDLTVFADYFVPALNISRRFVGSEPFSAVTESYNRQMQAYLPLRGVEIIELPRYEIEGQAVSASNVRKLLNDGDLGQVRKLVPDVTWDYLVGFFNTANADF